jgi:hypothetical protein
MRHGLLTLLSVWLALPVFAQTSVDAFSNCATPSSSATAKTTGLEAGQNGMLCFDFDSGFTAGSESLGFNVAANQVSVCLDPDRGGTAGSAVVDIQVCTTTDAIGDNTCVDTGLTLSFANPCEAVVRGRYRFEVTVAASGTENAQIVVRAY